MRKIIITSLIIVIIIFFAIKGFSKEDEIRVRVIPNSNCEVDLEVKEEVKNLAVDYLRECYNEDYDKFVDNILLGIEDFNLDLKKYGAYSSLENHTFYSKTYNGSSVKDETTLTFLVKIGTAKGDNWWGVVYPNFLDISSSDKVEYKSFISEIIKKLLD